MVNSHNHSPVSAGGVDFWADGAGQPLVAREGAVKVGSFFEKAAVRWAESTPRDR
jgi:hypothetical protein